MNNKKINIKLYNNLYTYEPYNNYLLRYYNDNISEDLILASELQVSLLQAIEKNNFKIFYFKNEPKSKLQITFRNSKFISLNNIIITPNAEYWNLSDKTVELENNDVLKIKDLLGEDINFLYKNQLFEILYKIPKLNNDNNYYYDFILVVNKDFNINLVFNYNFNLINIISANQLNVHDITYKYIENLFKNRAIFNNYAPILEKESYNFENSELSEEDFIKIYNNGDTNYQTQKYRNLKNFHFHKFFNQDKYIYYLSKLLDMQILSMDQTLVKIKNGCGFFFNNLEKYSLNGVFIFDSYIIGEKYCSDCVLDWTNNYSMSIQALNKDLVNNKLNLNNLPVLTENEIKSFNYNPYE